MRVVVELTPGPSLRPVLAAVLDLLSGRAGTELAFVLAGVPVPGEQDALALAGLLDLEGRTGVPDILLLTAQEAEAPAALRIGVGADEAADRVALAALQAFTELTRPAPQAAAVPAPRAPQESPARALRQELASRTGQRDERIGLAAQERPVVVVVVQHQSYWGATADVCRALAARDDVRLEVVALDSEHDQRADRTADFLAGQGYRARSVSWFTDRLHRTGSAVALAVFDNPYDGLRPAALHSSELAELGLRTAYVPYGNNVGAGAELRQMQYDLPLHRTAWRVFARSETQRAIYAAACAVGAEHVRVVGLPKLDRAAALAGQAPPPGRPVFLWNPHFTFGPTGWSTFDRYLAPLLEHFATHDDRVLLVRPHFRLFRDAALTDGPAAGWERTVRAAARDHDTIRLDESTDYLATFAASTALLSDASSLVTEFLTTGRPLLYLHKPDGPGINEDAEHFLACDVAASWPLVEGFLDDIVAGRDRSGERRRLARARHFPHLDGHSGERIADLLVGDLRRELSAALTAVAA